jgi:hypothetical protein
MYLTRTGERKYLITFSFINFSESTKTNFRPLNECYKISCSELSRMTKMLPLRFSHQVPKFE